MLELLANLLRVREGSHVDSSYLNPLVVMRIVRKERGQEGFLEVDLEALDW